MVFDCFPFFNELDVLEIRLHELAEVVDRFVIIEAGETYGGHPKPLTLVDNLERFSKFQNRMTVISLSRLEPECTDRTSGRLREAFQRNALYRYLQVMSENDDDIIIFSDCDEIPNRNAVAWYCESRPDGIRRLKQHSFYYNVQTRVDYGHDFASRARIGTFAHLKECGSLYGFRMHAKDTCPGIEEAGWHFSYFGGTEHIKTKVAALSPFLSEYKLFGDEQLSKDIAGRRDLHHRRSEMPEQFEDVAIPLPAYLVSNRDRFSHFFRKAANV